MSITCDNISFAYENGLTEETKDPLDSMDVYTDNPKYYRLEEIVFAEPIAINTEDKYRDLEATTELSFTNNLIVKKRAGKRNKYLIDVDNTSPNLRCPQSGCAKIFSTRALLRAHVRRVHCAERKYVCERCAAPFTERYLLQRHMATHSQAKTECPLCKKMLSTRTNMSVHLRSHADARTHACPQCARKFVRRATLNAHMRFVHREGGLRCRQCDEGFSSRKLLMNHKSCRLK